MLDPYRIRHVPQRRNEGGVDRIRGIRRMRPDVEVEISLRGNDVDGATAMNPRESDVGVTKRVCERR